jgi:hypothetical protein
MTTRPASRPGHPERRSRTFRHPLGGQRLWCGELSIYSKLIVPLQIDLAIDARHYVRPIG